MFDAKDGIAVRQAADYEGKVVLARANPGIVPVARFGLSIFKNGDSVE